MKDCYLQQKLENSGHYFDHSFSNRFMNWKLRHTIIQSLASELLRIENQDARILDVGCFEGDLIFKLYNLLHKKYRLRFTGIDLSPLGIDFANKRKELFQHSNCNFAIMDANSLAFDDGQFDIVICSEVVEHMQDPYLTIKEINRVLKDDGLAIITTPNGGERPAVRLSKVINLFAFNMLKHARDSHIEELAETVSSPSLKGQREKDIGFGHISVKSCEEWKKLLVTARFRIQKTSGTGGVVFGDPTIDEHRILFGLMVIFDTLFERFPHSYSWSENLQFELRKSIG